LEQVAWVDESPPILPASEAGNVVAMLLRNPALHEVFERRGRPIELFREQAADAIIEGQLLTGVIDRLLLHRNPAGKVTRVEIIDFKTDAVQDPAELRARHAGQLTAYRCALEKIYPDAAVRGALLSVRHGTLVFI
jgi:RecB family exonuclease